MTTKHMDLRARRKAAGVTLWELSAALRGNGFKLSPSDLSPMERGQKPVSAEVRLAIAKAIREAAR